MRPGAAPFATRPAYQAREGGEKASTTGANRVAPGTLGPGAVTLAHNLRSKEEVDELMQRAEAAGATVLKAPQEAFWGGYHGYFADPEGAIWEVAFNPFSPLAEDGAFCWNGYG